MPGICLIVAALTSPFVPAQTRCDIIEVNHVHDQYGFPKFVQLIAWDWCAERKRYHVRAWKLMDDAYQDGGPNHRTAFDAEVERIADGIKNWQAQAAFLRAAIYRGVFVGGRSYPQFRRGEYVSRITSKDGVTREVIANRRIETHTQFDREYADRDAWPESARVGW